MTPSDNSKLDHILQHYGVKGMQWGVRRSKAALATAAKTRKDAKASTEKTSFKSGSKDAPKNLTNTQLQDRIKRMELEKRYNDLNNPSTTKGESFTASVVKNSARNVAMNTLTGQGNNLVKMGTKVAKSVK